MKKTRNFSFIVELLLMFVILLIVIVVITQTFMTARRQSEHARSLTEAVCLARDVAEVSMSAKDHAGAVQAFEKMEQADAVISEDDRVILLHMDVARNDGAAVRYLVEVAWADEASPAGNLALKKIAVYSEGAVISEDEPVYTLETARYGREDGT